MFLCVAGNVSPQDILELSLRLERSQPDSRGPEDFTELSSPGFTAILNSKSASSSYFARDEILVIGTVRIYNRVELAVPDICPGTDDITFVAMMYLRHGEAVFEKLEGDYAFVIWDSRTRTLLIVRDCFGVERIFFRMRTGSVMVGLDACVVSNCEQVDESFGGAFIDAGPPPLISSTIWRDCKTIVPGTLARYFNGKLETVTYYSFEQKACIVSRTDTDAAEEFKYHLLKSVQRRIGDAENVWAELSGGLDSSSIVGISAELFGTGRIKHRLSSTYTFADGMAGSDDRSYAKAVAEHCQTQNNFISSPGPWHDDGMPQPATDEPRLYYPYWARDRQAAALVKRSGASFVLSGIGSDQYLVGSPLFLADLIRSGRPLAASKEAFRIAARYHTSVWTFLWRWGLSPLTRSPLNPLKHHYPDGAAPWIENEFSKKLCRLASSRPPEKRTAFLNRFQTLICQDIARTPGMLPIPLGNLSTQRRYPFLDKDLFTFALSLHANMMVRDGEKKWVLRAATGGVIPELVRRRQTKGTIDGMICLALTKYQPRITALLKNPILAQLGWVNPKTLRQQVENARAGKILGARRILSTLALETWLQSRAASLRE